MTTKTDETYWASVGHRLGQILGEALVAGEFNKHAAESALLGLKVGLRECGAGRAANLLKRIEEMCTAADVLHAREAAMSYINEDARHRSCMVHSTDRARRVDVIALKSDEGTIRKYSAQGGTSLVNGLIVKASNHTNRVARIIIEDLGGDIRSSRDCCDIPLTKLRGEEKEEEEGDWEVDPYVVHV